MTAKETLEETLDVMEAAPQAVKKTSKMVLFGVALAGAAVGAAISHVVTKKTVEEKAAADFDERLATELKKTVSYLSARGALNLDLDITDDIEDDPDTPEDVILVTDDPVPPPVADDGRNIVLGPVAAAVQARSSDEERKAKNQATPYHQVSTPEVYSEEVTTEPEEVEADPDVVIIARETFEANLTEWDQEILAYFINNDTVLNDLNEPITAHEDLIGPGPYLFGSLSQDENVVYIQNSRLQKEFMVIRDKGDVTQFVDPPDETPADPVDESLQHSMDGLQRHWESKRLG